ncbi:MAG: hypothetical protein IPJ18_17020 [Betaproteobacteria bacterium]|nr:hypothetical protein [Betaproteobacteria bacterium]
MTTSEDVKTLFRRFGGQPETYQEVVREDLAEHSLGKWPMLGQVNLQKVEFIPAAKQIIQTVATRPYSESLAIAQAGQIAVADYVASHRYVEPVRESHPAPQREVTPRHDMTRARTEPVTKPVVDFPLHNAPVQVPVPSLIQAHQGPHVAGSAAVRISTLPSPESNQHVYEQAAKANMSTPAQRTEQAVSGLAARFRAQTAPTQVPAPQTPEPPPPQSLHGLFGRLAQSQVKAQGAVGLLKRKLIT